MFAITQSCLKFESTAWNTRIVARYNINDELSSLVKIAANGNASLLDTACCVGHKIQNNELHTAIMGGHIECLKVMWVRCNNIQVYTNIAYMCMWAANSGHLEVLKWLRAQDPPCRWDSSTCPIAARYGHFEILKWLRSQNPPCPWDEWTCNEAAEHGHLDILKWARAQDPPCPWNSSTCSWAAQCGHLEILKWARAQNPPCPLSLVTRQMAELGEHSEILKWLDENGCP